MAARRLLAGCLALGLLTAPGLPAMAAEGDELLLLGLMLEQDALDGELAAYKAGAMVKLPLGELCRQLGLAIAVAPGARRAEGFVITEEARFELNLDTGKAVVAGQESRFRPEQVEARDDDLYVDSALLARWLPLDLGVDPFASRLTVRPREALPMQRRIERERRFAMVRRLRPTLTLPEVAEPYRLYRAPFVDPSLTLAMGEGEDGRPTPQFRYSTHAAGELLYMSTALYAAGNQASLMSDWRLTMSRKDPAGLSLGPVEAREVAFGDVAPPGLPLVTGTRAGKGVVLSNFPLTQQSQFDRHTFRGELPMGWDVELYRNEALLGYQQARQDGLYLFDEVPLLAGVNEFRLVFHGPQGQRREEHRRYHVGDALAKAGEQRYRAALNLTESGEPRLTWQQDWGLHPQLTASWGLTSLPGTAGLAGRRSYGLAGLRGYWETLFAHADLALGQHGGLGGEAGLKARLGPLDCALRHTRLQGLDSELFPAGADPLAARTSATVSAATRLMAKEGDRGANLVGGLEFLHDQPVSGAWRHQLALQTALRDGGVSLGHRLAWDVTALGAAPGPFAEAALTLGTRVGAFGLRGEVGYAPGRLREFAVTLEGALPYEYHLTATAGTMPMTGEARLNFNLQRRFDGFTLGLAAQDGMPLGVSLASGLGHDGEGDRYRARPDGLAAHGTVLARVFVDHDGDGRLGPGDERLSGVEVEALGAAPVPTDETGEAFISGLPAYEELQVMLTAATLPDPLLVPAREGVRVVPRPGSTAVVDLPVAPTGEVAGTVFSYGRAAGGVTVELVDLRGRVVKTARAAYDGFFLLTQVPFGRYTLRVAGRDSEIRSVDLGPGHDLLDGQDLEIMRKSGGQPRLRGHLTDPRSHGARTEVCFFN